MPAAQVIRHPYCSAPRGPARGPPAPSGRSTGPAARGLTRAHPTAALGPALLPSGVGNMLGDVDTRSLRVAGAWPAWLSPSGWGRQMHPFGGDHWWPLGLFAALFTALLGLAGVLAARPDVGRGMLPERRGRAHATPGLLTQGTRSRDRRHPRRSPDRDLHLPHPGRTGIDTPPRPRPARMTPDPPSAPEPADPGGTGQDRATRRRERRTRIPLRPSARPRTLTPRHLPPMGRRSHAAALDPHRPPRPPTPAPPAIRRRARFRPG